LKKNYQRKLITARGGKKNDRKKRYIVSGGERTDVKRKRKVLWEKTKNVMVA